MLIRTWRKGKKRKKGLTISVADPDPHHFVKLDPYPHQSREMAPHSDSLRSEKQDPDLDPHRSEKVEACEGHFGALVDPNLGESEW
jgi:hypothetical protein